MTVGCPAEVWLRKLGYVFVESGETKPSTDPRNPFGRYRRSPFLRSMFLNCFCFCSRVLSPCLQDQGNGITAIGVAWPHLLAWHISSPHFGNTMLQWSCWICHCSRLLLLKTKKTPTREIRQGDLNRPNLNGPVRG